MADELINPFTDIEEETATGSIQVDDASESAASQPKEGVFSSLQVGSGAIGLYVNRQGMWLGAANYSTAPFKSDMEGNVTANSFTATNPTLNSAKITSLASGTDLAIQGWSSTLVFSASTYRRVAWAGGNIILTGWHEFYYLRGQHRGYCVHDLYLFR